MANVNHHCPICRKYTPEDQGTAVQLRRNRTTLFCSDYHYEVWQRRQAS